MCWPGKRFIAGFLLRASRRLLGVAGLATGVYLLQVRQGARQQTLKLVRE